MAKIVIIGAGSGFGTRLSIDIMSREMLKDSTICLCDLHEGRLKAVTRYVQAIIEKYRLPTRLESNTDRTKLLPGADFVITSIAAGGGAYYGFPYNAEMEIPMKYGIDQIVGDSYSVAATFRLLRTGPVQLQICRDIEKYCPDAWLLNHTNPMAGLTMIHSLGSGVKNVGLCHGVPWTAKQMCRPLGISEDTVTYRVAGINHLAWFLNFQDKATGRDLIPDLLEAIEHPQTQEQKDFLVRESVRIDILKKFGYFPTESNGHDSEYMPYFRRTPELMQKYFLSSHEPIPDRLMDDEREWMQDGAADEDVMSNDLKLSKEYTTGIMNGILTDVPYRFNGNIMNHGVISNLPENMCVEVPCYADRHGINASYVGALPTHLAGLDRAQATCVQLTVESLLEKDKEKAFYAVALDPNVAAVMSLDQIRAMFEELWDAEGDLLEWYWKDHVTERYALN